MEIDNNKYLVYMNEHELRPIGGPVGYAYNLKKGIERTGIQSIKFIKKNDIRNKGVNNNKQVFKSLLPAIFKKIINIVKSIIKYGCVLYGFKRRDEENLSKYDLVHFHRTTDMYACRKILSDYNGIVVITSHSPEILSKEIAHSRSTFEKKLFGFVYDKLIRVDQYAFTRADYIMFPCEEAEAPYFNSWGEFKKIKEQSSEKFKYVLTGIMPCEIKFSRAQVRAKYNISENAFVICFIGRHDIIKGYDELKKIGNIILKNPNIYIIVAGREEPIKGLNNSRWIEIGWTSDPHSVIAASDLFFLPNRQTYFDLVLIEALSLGQIILASNTGGNRFFKGKTKGVMLYDDLKQALEKIKFLIALSEEEKKVLKDDNIRMYYEEFTCEKFAIRYLNIYNEMMKEKANCR